MIHMYGDDRISEMDVANSARHLETLFVPAQERWKMSKDGVLVVRYPDKMRDPTTVFNEMVDGEVKW